MPVPCLPVCPDNNDEGVGAFEISKNYVRSLPARVQRFADMSQSEFDQEWEAADRVTAQAGRGGRLSNIGWDPRPVSMAMVAADAAHQNAKVPAPKSYYSW